MIAFLEARVKGKGKKNTINKLSKHFFLVNLSNVRIMYTSWWKVTL